MDMEDASFFRALKRKKDDIIAAKDNMIASIIADKDVFHFDENLTLRHVHADIAPDMDLLIHKITSGYYRSNAVAHKKALDAYKKALEIHRKFVDVVHELFNGHGLDKNEVGTMLSIIYSLNDEDAVYNKIMKNQREEDARRRSNDTVDDNPLSWTADFPADSDAQSALQNAVEQDSQSAVIAPLLFKNNKPLLFKNNKFISSSSPSFTASAASFAKGEGGRRTRRYKKHSNKKRSGHKRLHKNRIVF